MFNTHAIENPFGISVFGSAIIRAEPDVALVEFSVNSLDQHPKDAFADVRSIAQKVHAFLANSQFTEYGSSRIALSEQRRYIEGENKFIGYKASLSFNLLLRNLDRVEGLLTGIVDSGANEIRSVDFQTSKLKALRAEARQRAIAAAREKAEIYCEAAKVKLGQVIHINDINPDSLRGREGHESHVSTEIVLDEEQIDAFNPSAIVVGGAVMVAFDIE